eukprot:jgi/Botrbrau1/8860/Bobra.50_2s0017.1
MEGEIGYTRKVSGVHVALEKICALEARLRSAIQTMQPISTSLSLGSGTAERERQALLTVREALELVEEKLREYSAMNDPRNMDATDEEAMILSQLDGLRKELTSECRDNLPFIVFGKDVVKEILQFSEMAPEGESLHEQPHCSPGLSPLHQLTLNEHLPHAPRGKKAQGQTDLHQYGHRKKAHGQGRTDAWIKDSDEFLDENIYIPSPPVSPHGLARGLGMPSASHKLFRDLLEPESSLYEHSANSYRPQSPSAYSDGHIFVNLSYTAGHTRNPLLSPKRNRDKELYKATNGGSKYRFDPEFGGKLSLRELQQLEKQLSPRTLPEKPRINEPKVESKLTAELFTDDESTASATTRYGGGSHPAAEPTGGLGTMVDPCSSSPTPKQTAGKVFHFISTAAVIVLLVAVGGSVGVLKTKRRSRKDLNVETPEIKGRVPGSSYPLRDNYYSVAPPTSKMFPVQPPPSFSISRG